MQRNRGKNRTGKARDLFKKVRNTEEPFHAKMGTIKDRNGMDLTEAEDIKKRSERKKGKIYPFECRVPKNSKER